MKKKLVAVILVLVLTMAMVVPVFAAEQSICGGAHNWYPTTKTSQYVSLGNAAGHWYIVYQNYACHNCSQGSYSTEVSRIAYPHTGPESCSYCGWHA